MATVTLQLDAEQLALVGSLLETSLGQLLKDEPEMHDVYVCGDALYKCVKLGYVCVTRVGMAEVAKWRG